MKKCLRILIIPFLLFVFCFSPTKISYAETEKVFLGGIPLGFTLMQRGAEVVGISDVLTEEGIKSPAKDAGVKAGDIIMFFNGIEVNNAKDLEKALICGKKSFLSIDRKGEEISIEIEPKKDMTGKYKLGLFIREEINGIGTVTYIKNKKFASLGHPIINDKGEILNIKRGEIYPAMINGVKKGERGKAGELHGVFITKSAIGKIEKNTNFGVFGDFYSEIDYSNFKEIEIGSGKIGYASIYSTIDGKMPKEYKISIIKADLVDGEIKNYVIKIEDDDLLNITGGIVQGMSGSPIVQDGKLIGAVTHVFINDPTRGFGVSIENMLKNS